MAEPQINFMIDPETGVYTLTWEDGFEVQAKEVERAPRGLLWGTLYPFKDGQELPLERLNLLSASARSSFARSLASANGAGPDYYVPHLHALAKCLHDEIPPLGESVRRKGDPADVWLHREPLADFLSNSVEMPEGLARDLVFPGGITTVAAPSGVGKSVIIYGLAYALAKGGVFRSEKLWPARVLLLDFDNPRSVVQKRMKGVCDSHDIDLQILGREHAPQLLDDDAWEALPADEHDVIIVDSFGSASVGISEKEGAKLQQALDTIKRVADRGPAVVVLDNTGKTGTAYRGRGEKVERVDAFYEARDITNWTPPQGEHWWCHLPSGDDAQWQERAARKTGQERLRVSFVCRKFRWGEEPLPFVMQMDFTTTPWTLSDVTAEIEDAGRQASQAEKEQRQKRLSGFKHK
jgi:AAA domain